MFDKINSGWRILKSEFANQFIPMKIIGMIFAIGIPIITIFATENFDDQIQSDWRWEIKKKALSPKEYDDGVYFVKVTLAANLLPAILIQGAIFSLFVRVFSILRDNSTMDKNRISFITHNKNVVVFTKFFVDLLFFIINIGSICLIAPISIYYYLGGEFTNDIYLNITKFFVSILFVYIFISIGIKLLNNSISNNKKRLIAIWIWCSISVGFYIVASSMTQEKNFYAFIVTNINLIKYIPFLNLLIPHLFLIEAGNLEWIDLLPMSLTTILIIQISWFIYVKKTKQFLCT